MQLADWPGDDTELQEITDDDLIDDGYEDEEEDLSDFREDDEFPDEESWVDD